MPLSGFEIAVGGITSIPVVGGLVLLGYKSFGEKALDSSKLKPKAKAKPAAKKDVPSSDKKPVKAKKQAAAVKEKPSLDETAASTESKINSSTAKKD